MECWPYSYKHWNSCLILPLQTLEFWPYFYNHWNYDLVLPNIEILILSFQSCQSLVHSFFNFCWLSLSRSFITAIFQGGLAAVLECLFFSWWRRQQWIITTHRQLNSQRLSSVLCSRYNFGLPTLLSHNLKDANVWSRASSMWSCDLPCTWR